MTNWRGWLKDESQLPSPEQETDENEVKAELKAKTKSLFCANDDLAPELDGLLIRKTSKGVERELAWEFRFCIMEGVRRIKYLANNHTGVRSGRYLFIQKSQECKEKESGGSRLWKGRAQEAHFRSKVEDLF